VWCESTDALVTNCTLVGNSAHDVGGGAYAGTLSHCTLRGNAASSAGGGASGGVLNHCTLTGNSADLGGGTFYSALNHCALTGNSAYSGGGAYYGTLNNCTLTGNAALSSGGGASGGTLNNCILYHNTASSGPNYHNGLLAHCCTTPLPGSGAGNITAEPLFVDRLHGNLRLQSNSPCINAGLNAYAPDITDLDGQPRTVGGTVDIGAYEFQTPSGALGYAWRRQFSLPTDGSADAADPDGDRLNNWQEWLCGTNPTNALSALRLLPPRPSGADLVVCWESVPNRLYFLERSTNLAASPRFLPLATNLPGQAGTTTYTDTNAARGAPCFYRVGATGP